MGAGAAGGGRAPCSRHARRAFQRNRAVYYAGVNVADRERGWYITPRLNAARMYYPSLYDVSGTELDSARTEDRSRGEVRPSYYTRFMVYVPRGQQQSAT